MENLFKQIEKEEEGELQISYGPGTKLITFHPWNDYKEGVRINALKLQLTHQAQKIDLENRLGDNQIGTVESKIAAETRLPDFQVAHHGHFRRLLFRKSNILHVKCSDEHFGKLLQRKLKETGLEKIAREHLFQLKITGQYIDGVFQVSTCYPLAFPAKQEVVRPLIALHKWLIDSSFRSI